MTWAADRKPPSNEYLLFEAQPPRMIPYAPIDVNARIYKIPTLMSLITNGLNCTPNTSTVRSGPNGMTAKLINAGTRARTRAMLKRNLSDPAGAMSSLKNKLSPSETRCRVQLGHNYIGPVWYDIQASTVR